MLLAAAAVVYSLALCWTAGALVEARLLRIRAASPFETPLVGLAALCILLTALSLTLPISPPVHGAVLGCTLAGALLSWKQIGGIWRETTWPAGLPCVVIAGGAVLWLASGPPQVYDTGFYHAQAVRWLNEHGTVPGLANLHGRLGFNSVWFPWAAFWNLGPLDGRACHVVNAAFWLLGAGLFAEALGRMGKGVSTPDLVQAGVLFPLLRFEHYAASLSPELPAHVLLIYGLSLMLRAADARGPDTLFRLALVCGLLPAVKLSAAPALLMLPVALWLARGTVERGWLVPLAGIAAAALGPFLMRNVLLTGYPLYPAPLAGFPHLDWKVPAADVVAMRQEVRGWAIEPGVGPAAASRPLAEWLGPWLARTAARHPVELAVLMGGGVACAALLVRLRGALPAVVPLAGVVYWFASAPDVRFGFGWITGLALVSAALLLQPRVKRLRWSGAVGAGALIWTALTAAGWARSAPPLLVPAGLTFAATHPVLAEGRLVVLMPVEGDQTWDAPLPNTPVLRPGLALRTRRLRDGFRILPGPAAARPAD